MCFWTIVLWGINPILTRLCSDIIGIRPYMIVTTITTTLSIITINTVIQNDIWSEVGHKMFRYHPDLVKRWIIALSDGCLCLAVPTILYNILLSNTNSIAIIVTTTWYGAPILTTVLSFYVFRQVISPLQMGGIVVSLVGIVMMNVEDIIRENRNRRLLENVPLMELQGNQGQQHSTS